MINSNPQYNDLIDAYFDNAMSVDERESFMNELENNSELKKEFAFQLELQEAISDTDYDKVNAVIADVVEPQENAQKSDRRKAMIFRIIKHAAVVAALLAFTFLLTRYFPTESSPYALVNEYFEPYPAYNTFRGDTDTEDLIESAFGNYESKKYDLANREFAQLSTDEPSNMAYVLYHANTLMAMKNFEEAQAELTKVVKSENELLVDQANWYLALSHLGAGEDDAARSLLESIAADEQSNYKSSAAELLTKL